MPDLYLDTESYITYGAHDWSVDGAAGAVWWLSYVGALFSCRSDIRSSSGNLVAGVFD